MTHTSPVPLERPASGTEPESFLPFLVARCDTGEHLWVTQSRSHPACCYLLTVVGARVRCPCPQFHYRGECSHAMAIHQALLASSEASRQPAADRPNTHQRLSRSLSPRPVAPLPEEERRCREAAERRERALLWTDDKPFSIWKS